jgi:hypothetical protein
MNIQQHFWESMARGGAAAFPFDVSDTGAELRIDGSTDVLKAREFFLLLSTTGLAFRRCELIWINGPDAGVHFVSGKASKKKVEAASQDGS